MYLKNRSYAKFIESRPCLFYVGSIRGDFGNAQCELRVSNLFSATHVASDPVLMGDVHDTEKVSPSSGVAHSSK